jgi:nitric oxide synthase oxygenase domain/subunit
MSVTTRKTTEQKWFCIDVKRADEIKIEIASMEYEIATVSGWIMEQADAGNQYAGIEGGKRARILERLIKLLREEHSALWRRVTKTVEEVIESTDQIQEAA